jgi:hypothetical protein
LSESLFSGKPSIFVQSNALEADMVIDDFVTLLPNPDGFWTIMMPEKSSYVKYLPRRPRKFRLTFDRRIRLSLTGGSQEQTAAFSEQLHRAARIVRDIVQAFQITS